MHVLFCSADFSTDDRYLYTAGGDGVAYQWDMRTFLCSQKTTVSDSLNCSAFATSPTGSFATGTTDDRPVSKLLVAFLKQTHVSVTVVFYLRQTLHVHKTKRVHPNHPHLAVPTCALNVCVCCCCCLTSGAESGIVSLFEPQLQTSIVRKNNNELAAGNSSAPVREFLNLTTTVDTLKFNPTGEMLVMASRMKRDALRVVCCTANAPK